MKLSTLGLGALLITVGIGGYWLGQKKSTNLEARGLELAPLPVPAAVTQAPAAEAGPLTPVSFDPLMLRMIQSHFEPAADWKAAGEQPAAPEPTIP